MLTPLCSALHENWYVQIHEFQVVLLAQLTPHRLYGASFKAKLPVMETFHRQRLCLIIKSVQ